MTEADSPTGRLRVLATGHIRSRRWAELIALEPALRADTEYWSSWWAAACDRLLGGGGEQPVPGHANTLSDTTDISGEVKRRFLPGLKAGVWSPRLE